MAWWPFGKKDKRDGRGRARSSKSLDKTPVSDARSNPQSRGSATAKASTDGAEARTAIQKSYTAPATVRNSMEKKTAGDEADERPTSVPRESYEEITALPGAPQHHEFDSGPHLRNIDQLRKTASKTRRGPMELATLRPKKSTKKKDDDRSRGAGLRSMTQPIPIPESRTASIRPRSSKRSLGRPATNHGESVVSLPRADSILSAATSKHEYHRFNVGIIDVFSARPKIRHSLQQPDSAIPSRAPSRRTTRSFSRPASRAHGDDDDDDLSVINDLADEYDAGAIRALMERDKRRVMRKMEVQEEKARRRLERQARREREAAGIANDPGEESSRGALHGLGLENIAAGPSSPVAARLRRQGVEQSQDKEEDAHEAPVVPEVAAEEPAAEQAKAGAAEADDAEADDAQAADAQAADAEAAKEPAAPSPVSPVSPVSKQDPDVSQAQKVDQSMDSAAEAPTAAESVGGPSRRTSVLSTKRGSAIASLFRKNKRNSLVDSTAGEQQGAFANTSREGDSRQPVPAHLREQPSLTGALSSIVPKRALSKFREHLHEAQTRGAPAGEDVERNDESRIDETAAGEPLSTSLASIGSEGSWLSGSRPPRKRESRGTVATPVPVDERPETSESDDIWVDAEANLARQSVRPQEAPIEEVTTTTAATTPQQEAEDVLDDGHLRAGDVAQKPVLMQRGNSARSREGLLTTVANQEAASSSAHVTDSGSGTPGEHSDGLSSRSEGREATARVEEITHFRSVTHARTVSSGSAKLLDIPARSNSQRRPDQEADA